MRDQDSTVLNHALDSSSRNGENREKHVSDPQQPDSEVSSSVELSPEGDLLSDLLYWHARNVIRDLFDCVRKKHPWDPLEAHMLAFSLVDNVLTSQFLRPSNFMEHYEQSLFQRAFCFETNVSDLVEHTLKVTLLATKLGSLLKYSHFELVRLALESLFHNMGMAFISGKILNKRGELTHDDKISIHMHPKIGADFVKELGENYNFIADVIYQVHERENGEGYPEGLSGDSIHMDAKIIGICDVYVALCQARINREALTPYEALQKILDDMEDQFAPNIANALLEALSMYPVGSLIQFESGEIGQVVAANPQTPMRPVVERLSDTTGHVYPPQLVDLAEDSSVNIKAILSKSMLKDMMSSIEREGMPSNDGEAA
ncbi:MAG: HD domain-containing protein [Nitrospinae bacterium]|nr:HD domain-containing protein [Nitrospinota bacterium]